jgi:hypothetical protein
MSGFPPAPSPRVSFCPIASWLPRGTAAVLSAWRGSVGARQGAVSGLLGAVCSSPSLPAPQGAGDVRSAHLRVGVHDPELDAGEAGVHHAVHGVAATAAHANHLWAWRREARPRAGLGRWCGEAPRPVVGGRTLIRAGDTPSMASPKAAAQGTKWPARRPRLARRDDAPAGWPHAAGSWAPRANMWLRGKWSECDVDMALTEARPPSSALWPRLSPVGCRCRWCTHVCQGRVAELLSSLLPLARALVRQRWRAPQASLLPQLCLQPHHQLSLIHI